MTTKKTDRALQRRANFVIGALGLIGIGLGIAIVLQVFVLNPAAQSNRVQILTQGAVLRKVTCAQAELTANASRYRQVGPHDKLEPVEHFRTRMEAQRHTLLAAKGLGCQSAPGFPPFDVQLRRALREIAGILDTSPERTTASLGGDALQPASAGQQPSPGQPGGHGTSGGTKTTPKTSEPPSAAGSPPSAPTGVPATAPEPPPMTTAPGSLDGPLHTVCSLVDHLAHLC